MNPRLQQLLTSWNTYLGVLAGLGALLGAFTDIFNKIKTLHTAFDGLPSEVRWVVVAALAIGAALLLYAALSRHSVLRKPERFLVSADNPRYLVGREEHIQALIDECEHASLLFLIGESGTGKSALIQAGILPQLHASTSPSTGTIRLVPLRLDASSLEWQDGLWNAVTAALHTLSEAELHQLGAPSPYDAINPFSWLARLPQHRASKLLLILDQMDDYLVAHQPHVVNRRKVVSPPQLKATNADWDALARLIADNRLHVVFVCRADSAATLDAFCFIDNPVRYLLPRVDAPLLAPLLDELTNASDHEVVVADPDYGWVQLKSRLLRDVSTTGPVLPVQLAVALNSLRRLRYLTPREYERHGGIHGLERLHIERHIRDVARGAGVSESGLLQGLLCLVSEDGTKTRRVSRSEFTRAVLGDGDNEKSLELALKEFERWGIVRRQFEGGEEFLLLYHDYLTRGVREVYLQANRWMESLRQQKQVFAESLGLYQRWRALLTPNAQIQLLWARLRGRFHYGIYQAFALRSVLRLLPWAAALAGIVVGSLWWQRTLEHYRAESLIAGILDQGDQLSLAQAEAWRNLAASTDHTRLHAVKSALSTIVLVPKLKRQAERVAHAVLGLDVDGRISRQLIREVFVPALRIPHPTSGSVTAVSELSLHLHYMPETASIMAAALVKRMETERDSRALPDLGRALGELSAKLEPRDVQPGAAALVKRMETERDSRALPGLGRALGGLSAKLEPRDVQPGAAALVKRMETERDSRALPGLGWALGELSAKLEPRDVQPGAAVLVKRMETERDSRALSDLGRALGELSAKLEPRDVQPLAAALVKRMETERDSRALSDLGWALGELSAKLEPRDVQPGAAALWNFLEYDDGNRETLVQAWLKLEGVANRGVPVSERCEKYAKVLQFPLIIKEQKRAALDGLETLTGERFDGDLWRFVDWTTTSEKAKSWGLHLSSGRPYMVVEGGVQGDRKRKVHENR